PVEVDERVTPATLLAVLQRARVLLQVRAPDAHALSCRELEPPVHRERQVELRDLVALRKVRIQVVLAIELRVLGRLAVERESRGDRELDPTTVRHRERAGEAETDRADERVRRRAEPASLAAAEHLRLGRELDVRL